MLRTLQVRYRCEIAGRNSNVFSSRCSTIFQTSMTATWPAYLTLLESGELARRACEATGILADCTLCPRECHADRCQANPQSFCHAGEASIVSSAFPHRVSRRSKAASDQRMKTSHFEAKIWPMACGQKTQPRCNCRCCLILPMGKNPRFRPTAVPRSRSHV